MSQHTYTAITFAPVQGFIEKSRKLRDLYGSSYLLSFLAEVLCRAADADPNCDLISPALVNNAKGTPNQILIEGEFPQAKKIFFETWQIIVKTCQTSIEKYYLTDENYQWEREWNAWGNYAWEFFIATDQEINTVRHKLSEIKRERNWIGINWQGESSSLTGHDGIAWPGMDGMKPDHNYDDQIRQFWQKLNQYLPESILDVGQDSEAKKGEQLSIPELIKRLVLLNDEVNWPDDEKRTIPKRITQKVNQLLFPTKSQNDYDRIPWQLSVRPSKSFEKLNRWQDNEWTGWFMGDGDKMGEYLQSLGNDNKKLKDFSHSLINWGKELENRLDNLKIPKVDNRIVYAGGDDFFGILSENDESKAEKNQSFKPSDCLVLLYQFHDQLWQKGLSDKLQEKYHRPLMASVGFVWAAPNVPQRDVLQHCRETEKSAKNNGRDRLAIRILFNSGNHLDWHCPWWFLQDLLESYCDREGNKNWTHFYNDVAVLESRHAFSKQSSEVAQALFEIYFGDEITQILENNVRGTDSRTKIVSDVKPETLNEWIINLAKVGFHLYD